MKENTLLLENDPPYAYNINRRKTAIASCLLIVVGTYLLFLTASLWWGHFLLYKFLPAIYLLGGCMYAYRLNKTAAGFMVAGRWLVSAATAAVIFLLLAGSLLWDPMLNLQTILASTGAFLLPFTVAELWQAYADLSFSGIKLWRLSTEPVGDLPSSYLHALNIRFRVIQEPDAGGGVITVLASGRMKLSDVFIDMVQKQNRKGAVVALHSRELEPHTFVFYQKELFFWYRPLDPDKTLLDNQIGKNALIYAQRVSAHAFATLSENEQNLIEP